MSTGKNLVKEIGGLMFLARAQLDDAGLAYLKSLKEFLSKQPPSVLVDALVNWNRSGMPTSDPRPPFVRVMGEESKPDHRTFGRGPFVR